MNAFTTTWIHSAPGIVAHVLEHRRRRIWNGLISAARSRRVVAIRDRDDLAGHAQSRGRIDLAGIRSDRSHVMLVGDCHRAIANFLLLSPHAEENEHSEPRMRSDPAPLLFGQLVRSCA